MTVCSNSVHAQLSCCRQTVRTNGKMFFSRYADRKSSIPLALNHRLHGRGCGLTSIHSRDSVDGLESQTPWCIHGLIGWPWITDSMVYPRTHWMALNHRLHGVSTLRNQWMALSHRLHGNPTLSSQKYSSLYVLHCTVKTWNIEEAKSLQETLLRNEAETVMSLLTLNTASGGCRQTLTPMPKRILFAPDQLSWAPTRKCSVTFWKREPENSFPSFLHTYTHSHVGLQTTSISYRLRQTTSLAITDTSSAVVTDRPRDCHWQSVRPFWNSSVGCNERQCVTEHSTAVNAVECSLSYTPWTINTIPWLFV